MVFGQSCFAQTSISIAPIVGGKAYTCSYGADNRFNQLYSEQVNTDVNNPYFTFRAKKVSFRPEINLGIQLGLSLNDGKHLIGIEWSTDGAGTMSKTTHFTSTNTSGFVPQASYNTYGNHTSYFQTGFVYNRLSLRYSWKMTRTNALMNVYLVPDISLIFGKANSKNWLYENDTVADNSAYFHNDSRLLSTEINSNYWGTPSILLGLGIRADFKTKKTKKYLFSIDIGYKHGFKTIIGSQETLVIADSGKKFAIINELESTGSGVYFQISRSFKLHTWAKKGN